MYSIIMDDIELGDNKINNTDKIMLFHNMINLKLISGKLTLFNWKKYCIGFWTIQIMFFISICMFMKPTFKNNLSYSFVILSLIIPLLGYIAVLINMFNGGWGESDSRFWCHVRIMFMHGYNTVRWTISSVVEPSLAIILTQYYDCNVTCSLWASVIIVMSYWIMSQVEISKSRPFNVLEKYHNDFDVDLIGAHKEQLKNTTAVDINGLMLVLFALTPWAGLNYFSSWIFILYQSFMIINELRYARGKQTFVQTDIQFDIIQLFFRTFIIWMFIFI